MDISRPPKIPRSQLHTRDSLVWSRVSVHGTGGIPAPRSGAASVVAGGKLYVFGGYGGGTGRLDDFWSFSFNTKTWEQVQVLSEQKPGPRENNGVVIADTARNIVLFGGYSGSSWLNDLWSFNIDTQEWTCIQDNTDGPDAGGEGSVSGATPCRRFGYVSVVHEGKLLVFGGFDGSKWMNDMHEFNFSTKTWREIDPKGALPSVRSCPAWAKDDKYVYVIGGYDGVERKSDFFALDLRDYSWIEMPNYGTPPPPRYFHSCALFGNKLYVYGGYSGQERLADMYAYDFETSYWQTIDCKEGDVPSGRSSLVAHVYENSLWVFGGYNGESVLNDFYKFRVKAIGVPPPSLVSDFAKLVNNPELSDVQFKVEDKIIHAHKAVLVTRSEYFRVMLLGGMRESRADEASTSTANPGDRPIDLADVSYDIFLKVLEFLYTDTVKETTLDTSIYLLIASELFMLDRLKALCEDLIRQEICVENVIQILGASHRHNAGGLKDIALDFIMRNLNDPCVQASLNDLRSEPDLLLEIIRRNSGALSPLASSNETEAVHQQQRGHFDAGWGDGNLRR